MTTNFKDVKDSEIIIMYFQDNGAEGYKRCYASLDFKNYPDGMPLLDFAQAEDTDITEVNEILIRPKKLETLVNVLFFLDSWRVRHSYMPNINIPYMPGGRQDRLNNSGDYLFTLQSIAKLINLFTNTCGSKIKILDPHSYVTPALINNCEVTNLEDLNFNELLEANVYNAVIAPDAGAEKRASAVAKQLGVPMLHGWKCRDVTTGKLTGFGIEPIPFAMSKALIVDDICDGGGTFIGLAEEISKARQQTGGPRIKLDLYTTHGIYSQGTEKLKKYFDNIYCTDSIVGESSDVIVLPICENQLNS